MMRRLVIGGIGLALMVAGGCTPQVYMPERAQPVYPVDLHTMTTTDADGDPVELIRTTGVQVFRHDTMIDIVNPTADRYIEPTIWINQRYACQIATLPAGGTVTMSLWDFFDQWGERFNAGGFWRSFEPTPVYVAELQAAPGQTMIGLIALPEEEE